MKKSNIPPTTFSKVYPKGNAFWLNTLRFIKGFERYIIKRTPVATLLLAIALLPVSAQQIAGGKVSILNKEVKKQERQVNVTMEMSLDKLKLKSNRGLVVIPMIVNGTDTLKMPAAEIMGRKRYIYYQRTGKTATFEPLMVVRRKNGEPQKFTYAYTTPYRKWMNGSQLVIGQDVCGCDQTLIEEGLLCRVGEAIPRPHKKCDTPPPAKTRVERIRQEKGSIRLAFNINKAIISENLGTNRAELDKMRKTIEQVKKDPNVRITSIILHGYASPDGNYAHNEKLALSRTKAVYDYISSLCHIDKNHIQVTSTAEDWQGVRNYVEKHEIPQRQIVIDILDNSMSPDEKERAIATKAPQAHRWLTDKVYPQLRRTDYTIEYEVKDISYEEARH